jgi:hypothetical protein
MKQVSCNVEGLNNGFACLGTIGSGQSSKLVVSAKGKTMSAIGDTGVLLYAADTVPVSVKLTVVDTTGVELVTPEACCTAAKTLLLTTLPSWLWLVHFAMSVWGVVSNMHWTKSMCGSGDIVCVGWLVKG